MNTDDKNELVTTTAEGEPTYIEVAPHPEGVPHTSGYAQIVDLPKEVANVAAVPEDLAPSKYNVLTIDDLVQQKIIEDKKAEFRGRLDNLMQAKLKSLRKKAESKRKPAGYEAKKKHKRKVAKASRRRNRK